MDIINIVNTMQPNTIKRLALEASAFPNGESCIPFMGVFIQLVPGATLPSEDAVKNYESIYLRTIAQQNADAETAKNAANPIVQIATLTAALINAGVINADSLPPEQLIVTNSVLESVGQPVMAISEQVKSR